MQRALNHQRRSFKIGTALSLAFVLAACSGSGAAADAAVPRDLASAGLTYLFQDALASPWADYSWTARNLANTSPVAAGTRSIRVDFSPWAGLYFSRSAFAANAYAAVVLQVDGGTASNPAIEVRAVQSSGAATAGVALAPSCTGGAITPGKWVTCRIPLSSLAPANASLTGLVLQEWAGKSLPSIYLDQIALEQAGQAAVAVAVTPSTAAVQTGQTAQFSAAVTGSTNTAVTWSLSEGAAGGSISSAGLYTAPAAAGTFHVVATSQADATKSATATITVTAPQVVAVSISPLSASLATGGTQAFTAQVTGSSNTAVTWSVREGAAGGSITSAGLYTAPAAAGTFHAVATSQADATKSAAATVTVTAACVPESDAAFCARLGKSCGTLSATDNCGAARTATCGAACPSAKESWVWVYTDYANVLASIGANVTSFTHVSPTFYTVNYSYQSGVAYYSNCPNIGNCSGNGSNNFSGLTTKQFTASVAALGLETVPAIYGGAGNSGTDAGIQNLLDNTNGAGDAFIAAMTTEAVNNGYAGYNLDWETGSAVGGSYADKFIAFANKFKAALAPHGMSLSVDAIVSNINGSWCSGNSGYLDFPKLAASSVDRIIIEDYVNALGTATTSCQNVVLSTTNPAACGFSLTGELNIMCSPNLPLDKAVIGLDADPGATNPIAGAAFSTIKSYGFTRVAVWPQAPFMSTSGIQPAGASWYALLHDFLAN